MDINDLRVIVTVLGFLCFLGICFWAYSRHSKASFDEAARLPLTDDDLPVGNDRQETKGNSNG